MGGETRHKLDSLLQRVNAQAARKRKQETPAVEGPAPTPQAVEAAKPVSELDARLSKAKTDNDKTWLVQKLLYEGKMHEATLVAQGIDELHLRVFSMLAIADKAAEAGKKDAAMAVLREAHGEAEQAGDAKLLAKVEKALAALEKPAACGIATVFDEKQPAVRKIDIAPRKSGLMASPSLGRRPGTNIQPPPPPTKEMKEKAEVREDASTIINQESQRIPKGRHLPGDVEQEFVKELGEELDKVLGKPAGASPETEEITEEIGTPDVDVIENAPKPPLLPQQESGIVVDENNVVEERQIDDEEAKTDEARTTAHEPDELTMIYEKEAKGEKKDPLLTVLTVIDKKFEEIYNIIDAENLKNLIRQVIGEETEESGGRKIAAVSQEKVAKAVKTEVERHLDEVKAGIVTDVVKASKRYTDSKVEELGKNVDETMEEMEKELKGYTDKKVEELVDKVDETMEEMENDHEKGDG